MGKIPEEKTAIWPWTPENERVRSGGPPRLAQRLPANQRAPEREERLVDIGPLTLRTIQIRAGFAG
jgi:hypothetical protein